MRTTAYASALVLTIVLLGLAPAGATGGVLTQDTVSRADLATLQDELDDLRADVDELPSTDERRSDLQDAIDEIDDEVAYLRVKLRREDGVAASEVDGLRERVSTLRFELTGETAGMDADDDAELVIAVGTEMDVRLQSSLNSDTAEVEDRFFATVVSDLEVDGRVAVPAGTEVRGVVSAVDRSSRTDRSASLTLAFDQLTIERRTYPTRLTLTEAQESGIRDEADRIGIGAAVGGVIGGIIGGVEGALTGILIGAGGTIAATEGEDVELPAGTVLRVRFDSSLTVVQMDR